MKLMKIHIYHATQVKELSPMFPLCMKNIFKILESGVKLKHSQRYQFSLFLKDLGMDLTEALKFWENYYSKIKGGR